MRKSKPLPFIVIALVLLAGVTGIIIWINSQNQPQPDGQMIEAAKTGQESNIQSNSNLTYTEHASFISNNIEENILVTYYGSGDLGTADGSPSEAMFALPFGLCFDNSGNLVVFDTFNSRVKQLGDTSSKTILGENGVIDHFGFITPAYLDGPKDDALFGRSTDGVYHTNGDLFIADSSNHVIRLLREDSVYTFAGKEKGSADGRYGEARFDTPSAIAIDRAGNLYVADTMNHTIRRIDPAGNVTTIAGQAGESGYADGAGSTARFNEPSGIAVGDNGIIYVADTGNHVIRKIESGNVSTIAGIVEPVQTGEDYSQGGYEDGPADSARFNFPHGLYISGDILFIADTGNHVIRALTSGGNIITVAGSGLPGDKDGLPGTAMMNKPMSVVYGHGVLYIADSLNNKIKSVLIDINIGDFR